MEGFEIVHAYSRAEAIEDGEFVDVNAVYPDLIADAGIKFPVAMTRRVWEKCVEVPAGVWFQDEKGRAWDILWLFACAARRERLSSRVIFGVHVRKDNREAVPPLVQLVAAVGPGDEGEPVITIMFPDED